MRKNELRKLRALNATRQMMEKAGRRVEVRCQKYDYDQHKYIEYKAEKAEYRLILRCQSIGTYLKASVFFADELRDGIRTPKYEVFINPSGKEYITRGLDREGKEIRWHTGMIQNLNGVWEADSQITAEDRHRANKTFISQDGKNNIKSLLRRSGITTNRTDAVEMINTWQQKMREQQIKEKEKREQEPWDADMRLVPKIPKGFVKWMQKETVRDDYIIYEYQKGGAKTGFCRHCGKDVMLKKIPHHREKAICPSCGRESELISAGKIKIVQSGKAYYGTIIQKIEGGFVVRDFCITCRIRTDNYREPEYCMWEYKRILVREGHIDTYKYEMYKNKYTRWCKAKDWRPWNFDNGKAVYKKNMATIAGILDRHSGLPRVLKSGCALSVDAYLYMESRHPAIEKMAKAGLEAMAAQCVKEQRFDSIDESQTELHKILRIDKGRMKRLRMMGAGITGLAWVQEEKRRDTAWSDGMIKDFGESGIWPDDLGFISGEMSYQKIWNYIKKQSAESGDGMWQVARTWKDYLGMAKKLKMDVKKEMVYKPRDLKAAHAEAIGLTEAKGIAKMAKEIRKKFPGVDGVCKTLGKYEYEDGQFCIKAPLGGVTDIVREGTILKHCIHTCDYYFDRISRKETYLVFLRKKPDKNTPWYTIELEVGGNIRQKRTVGDNQNKDLDEAIPFLKKWQKEIRSRLSEEEEALAEEADRKRKENYAKLRENGNKIWHGRLQGKLLADVLEQDFMEAI